MVKRSISHNSLFTAVEIEKAKSAIPAKKNMGFYMAASAMRRRDVIYNIHIHT